MFCSIIPLKIQDATIAKTANNIQISTIFLLRQEAFGARTIQRTISGVKIVIPTTFEMKCVNMVVKGLVRVVVFSNNVMLNVPITEVNALVTKTPNTMNRMIVLTEKNVRRPLANLVTRYAPVMEPSVRPRDVPIEENGLLRVVMFTNKAPKKTPTPMRLPQRRQAVKAIPVIGHRTAAFGWIVSNLRLKRPIA